MVNMEQGGFGSAIFTLANTIYFRVEYSKSIPARGSCPAQNRKSTDDSSDDNNNAVVFC